jgi:chitosanase
LMDSDHWTLALPIVVRALEISEQTLAALPVNCYAGPPPGSRSLFVDSPLMRGLDVRLAQLALSEHGYELIADGIFGRSSQKVVAQFQGVCGLPATGTIDAASFKALGVLGSTP